MTSTWTKTVSASGKKYPALKGELKADVAVIGSGLTGVSTAYLLSKAGKSVVLVSASEANLTTSAHTTGFLTTGIDTSLAHLVSMFGPDRAKAIWKSGDTAITLIEKTIREEHIECEFMRCSGFTYARTKGQWEEIQAEAKLARSFGFDVDSRTGDTALPFPNAGYMEIKNQAKFHALKYILALKERVEKGGVRVFDTTEAKKIERDGETLVVTTDTGVVRARDVVIATHYPFTKPLRLFAHTATYMTYVFELTLPKGTLKEGLYQDSNNPYHYFRVDREGENAPDLHRESTSDSKSQSPRGDRMIIGGEDHRKDVPIDPEKNYRALRQYFTQLLPHVTFEERLRWKWGIIEPLDGIPYIGPLKSDVHQYVATGFSGTGITMSRVAAEIITDAIMGKKNEWAELYRPERIPTPLQLYQKLKDYGGEFFGGAVKNALA